MTRAGFKGIATEWWHYQLDQARRYPVLNIPLDLEGEVAECTGKPMRELIGIGKERGASGSAPSFRVAEQRVLEGNDGQQRQGG